MMVGLNLFSFCTGGLLMFSACVSDPQSIERITQKVETSTEQLEQVRILYSDLGRIRAELTAPRLVHHYDEKEPYSEFGNGISIRFFDDQFNEESRLTAGYGILYEKRDEMIARNQVVVTNQKGEKLETEELIWNQRQRRLYNNRFVKITTADEVIYGEGFESYDDLRDYRIRKIRGTVQLSTSAQP